VKKVDMFFQEGKRFI